MELNNKLIVCISDLHACKSEFDELLNKISYNPNQMRLVIIGDFCDRGPDSIGCLRKIRELNLECVQGNHENKHIRYHNHEQKRKLDGSLNPMKRLSDLEMEIQNGLTEDEWKWMSHLPPKIHLAKDYWAIHAGVEPAIPFEEQRFDRLLRVRYVDEEGHHKACKNLQQPDKSYFWAERWKGPASIVYGHSVVSEPRIDKFDGGQCIGIDTGCCFGGKLTAWIWNPETDEQKFVSVKAHKTYIEYKDKT